MCDSRTAKPINNTTRVTGSALSTSQANSERVVHFVTLVSAAPSRTRKATAHNPQTMALAEVTR